MNNDIKLKITSIVTTWELENPTEYSLFLEGKRQKELDLKNKFAELPGGADNFIVRALYEIPETLDARLQQMDDSSKEFLKSLIGAKWFAKTFKQYNVSGRN